MGLLASSGRRRIAVVLAWALVAGVVFGAVYGACSLAEAIRTDDRVGIGICVPLGGLLFVVACTWGDAAWAKLTALYRRTVRVFGSATPHVAYHPVHPIEAPEPWLERLMQDTRSILHELSHLQAEAEWWPSDEPSTDWIGRLRGKRRTSLGNGLADFTTVNRITRDVWEWVRAVERFSPEQRSYLEARGIDVGRLREALLADGDFHGRFLAMGRLLRGFEDNLFAFPTDPFRGIGASQRTDSGRGPRPVAATPSRPTPTAALEEPEPHPLEQTYRSLVRAEQSSLRGMAARFARTPEDRDDLYQDMLLAIWKALPAFRGECSLSTYARRVAHSTAVDHVRRRRITEPEVDPEDRSPDPEQRLGMMLAGAQVRTAIDKLPEMLRDVVLLHLDGHDYREIAQRTGIGPSNVGARLTRARARLRRRLGWRSKPIPDGTVP